MSLSLIVTGSHGPHGGLGVRTTARLPKNRPTKPTRRPRWNFSRAVGHIIGERGARPRHTSAVGMDRELVVRARDGDREAFSQLARMSIGRLNAVARLIVHDAAAAEDAVQDTLVSAWVDLPGLRDPDRFDAWLRVLLVRSCRRVAKGDWRRRTIELPLIDTDIAVAPDDQNSRLFTDAVDRGLQRLTIDQRTVLVLAYYLDLPLADVA